MGKMKKPVAKEQPVLTAIKSGAFKPKNKKQESSVLTGTKPKNKEQEQPLIKHDAFISKNKKRKEKRHMQNLIQKQGETGDFIPVKKHPSKPSPLTGLSKKQKSQLSTSLPIKGSEKSKRDNMNNSFAASALAANQPKKVTGILSNPNTPKRNRSKNEHVTFELSKNTKKFLDEEPLEGEKLFNDKVKKPFLKGGKKQPPVESSDESDEDENVTGEDFLDMEASEGEETGSEASSDDDNEGDDDLSDENTYLSSFLNDDESDSADDDEEDDDDDDDQEEDADSDDDDDIEDDSDELHLPKRDANKLKNQKLNNGPVISVDSKEKSVELKTKTTPAGKGKLAEVKNEERSNSLTPTKKEKVTVPKSEEKNAQKKLVKSGDSQVDEKIEKKNKKANTEEMDISKKEKFDKPSNFIGFIRKVPPGVTQKSIKTACSKIVAANDVLSVVLVKVRRSQQQNAFIYLKDSQSLGNLVHKKIDIGDSSFVIYRSKSSAEEDSPPKSVAFLPRVPQWITEAELKQAVEKLIGVGKVKEVIEKKVNKIQQTKNILLSFVDTDALKKAIQQGDFTVKDQTVIIREAVEGISVPVYRAVLGNIPEKTNEDTVKKILEASIGKNTVVNVRFSFRKKSFAFVVFNDEAAMKKVLALGDNLSLKGNKLEVRPYVPHKPRKRAPPSEQTKAKAAEKRKRKSTSKVDGEQEQASPKKQKTEDASSPNESRTAKKKNRRKKSNIASPSGQVKATKNLKAAKQKQSKPSPVPSPTKKDSKVSVLKEKIRSKKELSKGQKKSKPQKQGKK